MKIPEIQPELILPLLAEIEGAKKDLHWAENKWTELRINQPVLAAYLEQVKEECGGHAVLTGMIVYTLIKAQLEVNELEELFDDSDD